MPLRFCAFLTEICGNLGWHCVDPAPGVEEAIAYGPDHCAGNPRISSTSRKFLADRPSRYLGVRGLIEP